MNGGVCALLLVMVFVPNEAGFRMISRVFIKLDDISIGITDKNRKGTHALPDILADEPGKNLWTVYRFAGSLFRI
jgi:hypothetical protein